MAPSSRGPARARSGAGQVGAAPPSRAGGAGDVVARGGVRARVVSHRWCLRVEFVRGRGACGAADGGRSVGRASGRRHGRPGAGDGGRGMTDSSERAFVKV